MLLRPSLFTYRQQDTGHYAAWSKSHVLAAPNGAAELMTNIEPAMSNMETMKVAVTIQAGLSTRRVRNLTRNRARRHVNAWLAARFSSLCAKA
jgi:hypothetical protein